MESYPLSVREGGMCERRGGLQWEKPNLVAVSLGFYPTRGSRRVQNLY